MDQKQIGVLLAGILPAEAVWADEPMEKHTSFRIGGPCDWMATPRTEEELCRVLACVRAAEVPYFVLGNGTNLLCSDAGFRGVVIRTAKLDELSICDGTVRVGAGLSMTRTAFDAANESLTGLEFAHGIPGSIGGGVVMNAGAYGGEMAQVVSRVFCVDQAGTAREFTLEEAELGYRSSRFQREELIVTGAELKLEAGDREEIRAAMADLAERRRSKQPLELPSAGSVFKRPPNGFAAAMIDQCGLKGYRIGGACVSEKHAGFIVNLGGATCADVLALVDHIKACVSEAFGTELQCEIKRLGD
ncbi:MAG: UDP-N-acetylmuramate dehydrogenase [Ruminococcaceae bacterium]|nr:UDP-N-acetylmuramate dehydrogenase [Oscillospiraceae bacterium]